MSAKKGIVITGWLPDDLITGSAFWNTAKEVEKDLGQLGYATELYTGVGIGQLKGFLNDPDIKAFCFIGHGGSKNWKTLSDSETQTPAKDVRTGNDTLWINEKTIVSAYDIQQWRGELATELVILHACYQNKTNTAKRWQTAFNVASDGYHSWTGLCRYMEAYWWQKIF